MADPLIDPALLELVERRLADSVATKVKTSLFATYSLVGVVVGSVLGYVGYDFVGSTKRDIEAYGRSIVERELEKVTTELTGYKNQVADARRASEKTAQLSDWLSERAQKVTQDVDERLRKLAPKMQQIDGLGAEVDDLMARAAAADATRKRLEADLLKLPSTAQVASIMGELNRLGTEVESLAKRAQATNVEQGARSVAAKAAETRDSVVAQSQRTTVYIQFAGPPRDAARELARALQVGGYIVPEPDREAGAAGKREIRYFFEEDADASKRLAEDVRSVLDAKPVGLVPLLTYPGRKPPRGTLELWIELPYRTGGN